MARKRIDPVKQREKRAKIAVAVGLVLFLAVAAYEVPSLLKLMNQKPPPSAYATDAGNRNPDGSIPGSVPASDSGLTGAGQLADTDVPPESDGGQLVAFGVFQTKNPFTPQVTASDIAAAASAAGEPTTANKHGADVPPTAKQPKATLAKPPAGGMTMTTVPAAPAPVTISVNGVVSHVGLQGTFPTGAPVFRVVSATATTVEIGIVGGSYASGGTTLTLHVGQPVTLENTTDQKSYRLILVSTH